MTTATLQRGQKLYRAWNGVLETVQFREQSVAEGAFAETWVVWDGTRRIRCSVGSYHTTPYLAWAEDLKRHEEGLKAQRKHLAEVRQSIKDTKANIVRLRDMVRRSRAD